MKLNRLIWFIAIIAMLTTTISGCNKDTNKEYIAKTEFLMDTVITLRIYDKQDEKILDEAINRLKEIEDKMSSHIETSYINEINKNAGIKPIKVDDEVYYVIEKAKYFATISNGAYEPTIGPLVDLWNITGTDEKERNSIPSKKEIKEKLALVDYRDLELMKDNYIYLNKKGMKIDLGGIVKGYAADEIKEIFIAEGVKSAIIDLGGNVYALGEKSNGDMWRIGIQDPFNIHGSYTGILGVKDKSLVTSGDYERFFKYKGEKYHHIIDSKTGYPSKNEVSGISIISDKSIDGDALSTALFVLGIKEGTKLIKELENINAIFITKEEKVYVQEELLDHFDFTNGSLKLITNPY